MYDLSVIMPSFNQGAFIEEAINSVLRQRDIRSQLIIMDGGSSDQTLEILRKYSGAIYYRSEPDGGQAHALNKALALAEAPVISWLNSDDVYLPGSFRRALRALAMNPDVSLVHGQRVLIDASSSIVGWDKPGPFDASKDRYNICSETAFWRKECIPGHFFRESLRFAMDTHFLGTIARDKPVMYIPRFQGCLRCHTEAKSSNLWHEVAVPEATSVWHELFGSKIDMSVHKDSRTIYDKVLDLLNVPLAISTGYISNRLRRKIVKQVT